MGAGIKKGEWTEEEDRIIINMQRTIGNQWAKITKMLPGRTDNAVKNRFHATERARSRGGRIGDDNSYQSHLPMYNPSSGQYKVEKTGTGFHHNYDGDNVDCSESENDYEVEDDCGADEKSEGDSATDLMELDIISFDEEDFAFDNEGTMSFDPNGNGQNRPSMGEKAEIDPCCFNFDWCNRMTGGAIKQEPGVMPPQPPQYYPIGGFGHQNQQVQQQQQHFYQQHQQQQQMHLHQQQQQQYGAYPPAPQNGMNLQNRFPGGQPMPQRTWM